MSRQKLSPEPMVCPKLTVQKLRDKHPHPLSALAELACASFAIMRPHKPFVPLLQLRKLPAGALDLAPIVGGLFLPIKVYPFDLLRRLFTIVKKLIERNFECLCVLRKRLYARNRVAVRSPEVTRSIFSLSGSNLR
jgi:hypothetical protein